MQVPVTMLAALIFLMGVLLLIIGIAEKQERPIKHFFVAALLIVFGIQGIITGIF